MDSRRLIVFVILSLGLLILWEKYVSPQQGVSVNTPTQLITNNDSSLNNNQIITNGNSSMLSDKTIAVTTDVIQAQINTAGGDLRSLDLLTHGSQDNVKEPYKLLMNTKDHVFIAQTGLVSNSGVKLPNHHTIYTSDKYNYVLANNEDKVMLTLKSNDGSIEVTKSYVFKRGSYVVDLGYEIVNNTQNPLSVISAYWSLLRDDFAPDGETKFVHTFTGPAYYTNDSKFETIKFSNINKNNATYPENTNNGWVGFIQHYFSTLWLLNANGYQPVCANGIACRLSFKPAGNNLVSAGLLTDLPVIAPHAKFQVNVPLFVGPQDYKVMSLVASHLELTKDYGWVYIFATPLFWLLVKIFELVNNWGVAIILLTFAVKVILYPLTRASYVSMAKMKALAPKMEQLKSQHGSDKVKLQQAMMQLYKTEKVNPIGGCLPMLLQIPVFIGLYWALLSSVELRNSPFLWVSDLSAPDPYYIMPIILAGTMFLQTFLNPAPTDPIQAKMMRIMPIAFSIMFFFFPAGLVVYWLTNNILSMAQQWYVNNHVTLRKQNKKSYNK